MRHGQALVVILLILAVALTLGLTIVARTITDVGTSTTQEESSKALTQAESGVEAALSNMALPAGVTASDYSGRQISISQPLAAGESSTIFLADHKANGDLDLDRLNTYSADNLDLCWGTEIGSPVAIEASLYYKEGGSYKVRRMAYDPEGRGGFETSDPATTCPSDYQYKYQKRLSGLPSGKILLRVRLLYNGDTAHFVGVSGPSAFPIQGKNIVSTASEGNTTRKIEVFQRYPDLSPLLDSAVFSGGALSK
jgi:hypothetical protein